MKYIIDVLENKSILVEPVDHLMKLSIGSETVSIPFMACCDLTKLLKEHQDEVVTMAAASCGII